MSDIATWIIVVCVLILLLIAGVDFGQIPHSGP